MLPSLEETAKKRKMLGLTQKNWRGCWRKPVIIAKIESGKMDPSYRAPSTPRLIMVKSLSSLFSAATVAGAIAFAAALLLFKPFAIGMLDHAFTLAPYFSLRPKYSRTLFTVFSIKMSFSFV